MPTPSITPLNPLEQDKPPAGAEWIHEIKWDGYRVQVHLPVGKVPFDEYPGSPPEDPSCCLVALT